MAAEATEAQTIEPISVGCCIAGGGPAGIMLGYLLARAGIDVLVLEKHADFLRDFRGDTIHPSTLEIMHELGLLDAFLKLPHSKVETIGAEIGKTTIPFADLSHLPTHCRFVAFIPQWDFLQFIAAEGARLPSFALRMEAEAGDLIEADGRIVGLRAKTPQGVLVVRADLVVGADGRHSTVRTKAGLEVRDLSVPMDVLWLRLPKHGDDPPQSLGHVDRGRIFVMLDRGDYWQCAFVIAKGQSDVIHGAGLEAFRRSIGEIVPYTRERLGALASWDDVKLLTVTVDRLPRWYRPGLLCIGDAAHAMSPIGGVGINLAIQDAVAAANLLAGPLKRGRVEEDDLRYVQRRRELPTRLTQAMQLIIQNRIISRVLAGSAPITAPPLGLRLFAWFPLLRRIPARVIGMGFRPEHVRIGPG